MSRGAIQNFRGVRAAVLHPADHNRDLLAETLARLGLRVLALNAAAATIDPSVLELAEIVLFDADSSEDDLLPWAAGTAPIPLIAVIGLESPTRLQRAFDHAPAAVLHKPVRSNGIYTALYFAANESRRRMELRERLRALEARHGARRFVLKAVIELMRRHHVGDDEAYRLLRKESMRQRTTVEELAVRVLAAQAATNAIREA